MGTSQTKHREPELHAADPIGDHVGHIIQIIDRGAYKGDRGPITITCVTCCDDIAWEE